MTEKFPVITAPGVSLTHDLDVEHIGAFEVEIGGLKLTPLHTAPWVIDDPGIAPNLKYLSVISSARPSRRATSRLGTDGRRTRAGR